MNLADQVTMASFHDCLQKWAQEGFSDVLADIAKPVVFGLGGYVASRALGGEARTGIPDWLLGPTAGVGIAMPVASAIARGISNWRAQKQMAQMDAEQQARLEQALAQEQALQEQMSAQSQEMLRQMAAYQMGMPPEAYMKMGQLRVPAQQADQIATQAQQSYQQGTMQQLQQQMQGAAVAQAIKAQMRGVAQAQQNLARRAVMGMAGASR